MLQGLVFWFHIFMAHIGVTHLLNIIKQMFFHPCLQQAVKNEILHCLVCQCTKTTTNQY